MKAIVLLLTLLLAVPARARADDVMVLLQQGSCPNCRLADADLVHVDLRGADLQGAQLQRANLGQAQLDGADLSKTNLKFTNLRGASLRGADLRGSQLYGTDLRQTNLSGAQLDEGALEQAHWEGAIGIKKGVRSHAALHNAGVTAAENGRWKKAEALLSTAITANPDEPLSWVARGLCRIELGRSDLATRDLNYAENLYRKLGDFIKAEQLELASKQSHDLQAEPHKGGNNIGTTILSVAISILKALGPIAIRALSPI